MFKPTPNQLPADRTRRAQSRLGVAAAELAVCLPVIVLLVLATIEACSMVFLKQTLSIAAYEGVRTAISTGATADDVEQVCDQVLLDRGVNGGTVSIVPNNVAGLTLGDLVDVTVSAPCDGNMVLPNMFYRDRTLSATASMMTEL